MAKKEDLKHVKLFEQFEEEGDSQFKAEGAFPEDYTDDKVFSPHTENIPYTNKRSLVKPEYFAKDGDFIVFGCPEFPSVGFVNNEKAFQYALKDVASYEPDNAEEFVQKIPLKKGDCYIYHNQGEATGITQDEFESMDISEYTYIVSTKKAYYHDESDGLGTIFAIPTSPTSRIRGENHAAFLLDVFTDFPQ